MVVYVLSIGLLMLVLIVLPLWKIYRWTEASVTARLIAACLVPIFTWIAYFGLQGYTEFLRKSK